MPQQQTNPTNPAQPTPPANPEQSNRTISQTPPQDEQKRPRPARQELSIGSHSTALPEKPFSLLRRWGRSGCLEILDWVYPPECHFCEVMLKQGNYLCDECWEGLRRVEKPFCSRCGEVFQGQIHQDFVCPNCGGMQLHFDFAKAALRNSEDGRDLVHSLKYRRRRHLVPVIGELMHEAYLMDPRFAELDRSKALLVPVPLHWRRQHKRHFNQSEDIAIELSKLLGIKQMSLLARKKNTVSQTKLGRAERLANLKEVFAVRQRLLRKEPLCSTEEKSLTIILVDDVLTTGSTADACAKVLKQLRQVERVVVLTLLRG